MLKVVQRIIEKSNRKCVVIDDMQFGFISGRGTADAMLIAGKFKKYFGQN